MDNFTQSVGSLPVADMLPKLPADVMVAYAFDPVYEDVVRAAVKEAAQAHPDVQFFFVSKPSSEELSSCLQEKGAVANAELQFFGRLTPDDDERPPYKTWCIGSDVLDQGVEVVADGMDRFTGQRRTHLVLDQTAVASDLNELLGSPAVAGHEGVLVEVFGDPASDVARAAAKAVSTVAEEHQNLVFVLAVVTDESAAQGLSRCLNDAPGYLPAVEISEQQVLGPNVPVGEYSCLIEGVADEDGIATAIRGKLQP
ncbi:MAG TPA: hypothetical protein ENJ85_05065 [Oceanithermus profundus]|uniref:Uncharacterized protein n=1 Tax=Oceanithermus profundus TaxID=187137 RepID=A0A7C5SQL7_9DEIN|nr:hypothetical protein [Oceanithermus profundus]